MRASDRGPSAVHLRCVPSPRRRAIIVARAVVLVGMLTIPAAAEPPSGVDIDAPAIAPAAVITLFDGTTVADLRHFYFWLGPKGYDDPNGVFTVVKDVTGGPTIRVSGQDKGGFVTRKNYRDYRLVLEYRWGEKTWNQRARNSGVLFHCQGEDGNRFKTFQGPWISSVEYEIQEGRTGAVILLPGFSRDGSVLQPTITMRTRHDRIWDPEGP
ncbi:MAG: family 16 glycoside hydrolase, partial [Planctomycetia bacterium]